MATTAKKTALDPRDFLALDALLDDEERAIRDTVRDFVRKRILPEIGDWFELIPASERACRLSVTPNGPGAES